MAGASLLTLIDNIATLLEDISVLSKVAVSKTAGVLGDDLALNAQQVHGVDADRELPVVWAVAKGSLVNKAILCPTALAVNYVAPWGVTPLLVIGGIYLCFEGVEKICHKFLHGKEEDKHHDDLIAALSDEKVDMVAFEKERIQGAVRTDFVLSAEIIVITLGLIAKEPFWTQVAVMIAISMIMTVGVYGLVGGIVKLDDIGLAMSQRTGGTFFSRSWRWIGRMLVQAAPKLLKLLSIVGTIAMFTVGGGIIVHGIKWLGNPLHHFAEYVGEWSHLGWPIVYAVSGLLNIGVGLLFGAAALLVVEGARKVMGSKH